MVTFGSYALPHVLDVQVTKARQKIERPVPYRNIAYRVDQADLGQTVRLNGEIRADTLDDVHSAIEQIRTLNDGTGRSLDLEDGETAAFDVLLTDPEYDFQVGYWSNTGRCYIPYSLTFLQVDLP
jgi:hypothetical protein